MNKRPTVPAPKKPAPAPTPAPKRTPKEEGEKEYMKKKYPFNTYAKGGKTREAKFGGGGKAMTTEQKRKLAEATAKRGSESRGLDLRQEAAAVKKVARNLGTRSDRAYGAVLSGMGAAALGGAGLLGKAIGDKEASGNLTRARGALKDVGKFAKAAIVGEPKGEKYNKNGVGLGKYYLRGSDVDWEKKEGKAKGGKVMKKASKAGNAMKKRSADTMGRAMMAKGGKCYAKGGSVSARADGIAQKGKTKGKVL